MSAHADNLGRAARLLKRIGDIEGPSEFEGVALTEIVGDVLMAQNRAYMDEAMRRAAGELPDNVVLLDSYSRRVPCA